MLVSLLIVKVVRRFSGFCSTTDVDRAILYERVLMKVISREYKLMLRKELFTGDEQQVLRVASAFWHGFTQAINNMVLDVDGDLQEIADKRIIKFYDTDENLLSSNHYILRERYNISNDNKEITLKFRHPDRYISQDRNMNAGDAARGKTKFEEDIKADTKSPFSILYSFSTTQKISFDENLSKLQDAARLYPDLQEKLIGYTKEKEIKTVGITVRELVIKGAKFQIKNQPRLDSECSLIVWYDDKGDEKQPVAVEFSFKYGDENEDYTSKMAHRAYDVFQGLQKLTSWVDPESDTKTAYIYRST